MVGRAANEAEGSQGWFNTEPAGAPPCSLRAHRDYNDAYFRQSLIGGSPARETMSVGRGWRECAYHASGGFL